MPICESTGANEAEDGCGVKKGFLPRSDEELGGSGISRRIFVLFPLVPRGVQIGIRVRGCHGMTSGCGTFGVSLDNSDVEGWDLFCWTGFATHQNIKLMDQPLRDHGSERWSGAAIVERHSSYVT